jgi:hypothetical protein
MTINDLEVSNLKKVHRPGLEPGSIAWEATIIPLDQRCYLYYSSQLRNTPERLYSLTLGRV